MNCHITLRERCPHTEFSGPYFPLLSPNTGKYGPEKTPYLATFHTVLKFPRRKNETKEFSGVPRTCLNLKII